jgi:hypothetical protein
MQHAADRPRIATGVVLFGTALVVTLVIAAPVPVPDPAGAGDRLVTLTSDSSGLNDFPLGGLSAAPVSLGSEPANAAGALGLDVADLDSVLKDIGLGGLVTNNDFQLDYFLDTYPTLSVGQWFFGTAFVELLNLFTGVDESTLTGAVLTGLLPVAQDVHDMLNGTGDSGTDLSQLFPDIEQGFAQILVTTAELFLSA